MSSELICINCKCPLDPAFKDEEICSDCFKQLSLRVNRATEYIRLLIGKLYFAKCTHCKGNIHPEIMHYDVCLLCIYLLYRRGKCGLTEHRVFFVSFELSGLISPEKGFRFYHVDPNNNRCTFRSLRVVNGFFRDIWKYNSYLESRFWTSLKYWRRRQWIPPSWIFRWGIKSNIQRKRDSNGKLLYAECDILSCIPYMYQGNMWIHEQSFRSPCLEGNLLDRNFSYSTAVGEFIHNLNDIQ